MTASPADVARRAAVIVQARGHCKGELRSLSGQVCLWGAITESIGEQLGIHNEDAALLSPVASVIRKQVAHRFPPPAHMPVDWIFAGAHFNDDPATTATDVAKLLLQVADDIEFGGAT